MNRIGARFDHLRATGRKALIPYLTAGDPDPAATTGLMHALVAGGADIVEVGVPFSDPQADGPVIQAACQRALAHHVRLRDVLDIAARFRAEDGETPVVLMGYLNPIEAMGGAAFAARAAEAGVDGVLIVDQPPEEGGELLAALEAQGLDAIFLIAPTTADERMAQLCARARGFVYYVSLKGVTGAATLAVAEVEARVAAIRACTDLPVGVGFGIHDADAARRLGACADAVVVGSAVVERVARHGADPAAARRALTELMGSMRAALDVAPESAL
jgi:tryptophan synthase alpha chain